MFLKLKSVDYGAGASYRQPPARKQMLKDCEWFGMTIVADGNHLATRANGVQVTHGTDNRPKSDNARTGCKLEEGHVSIQGCNLRTAGAADVAASPAKSGKPAAIDRLKG